LPRSPLCSYSPWYLGYSEGMYLVVKMREMKTRLARM